MSRVAALLLAGLLAPGAASADASSEALRDVLLLREHDGRTRDDVLAEMVGLGPSAIPSLFGLYAGTKVSLFREDAFERWWGRPDGYGELALDALCAMPPDPVLAHVLEAVSSDSTEAGLDTRLAGLGVLGALGSARGLPGLLRIAETSGPRELGSPVVRSAFRGAIDGILRTDRLAVRALEKEVDQLGLPLATLLAETCGHSQEPDALRLLEGLAGRSPELDRAVAAGIAELTDRFPWRQLVTSPELLRLARSEHPEVRAAAVLALASTGDAGVVPVLLAALEDPEGVVSRAARAALARVSGLGSSRTAEQWTTWFRTEVRWWTEHREEYELVFAGEDAALIARATRELGRHPIARGWLSERLALALARLEGPYRIGFVRTLEELDSRRAVPGLVDLLFDPDAATRSAAGDALRALTGQSLPSEPRIWERYVNG